VVVAVEPGNLAFSVVYMSQEGKAMNKRTKVHASHLKFYDHASLVVTPELLKHSEWLKQRKWEVESILAMRKVEDQWQLYVKWDALEPTWEELATLLEDVPSVVKSFLDQNKTLPVVMKYNKEKNTPDRKPVKARGQAKPHLKGSVTPVPLVGNLEWNKGGLLSLGLVSTDTSITNQYYEDQHEKYQELVYNQSNRQRHFRGRERFMKPW
jgi:hypothetical protein